jgi:hypothetical protein
MLSTLSN